MQGDTRVTWPVISRQELGRGAISAFVDEKVATPAGTVMHRQFLTHPGAVAIVAWNEGADTIAVVRQYRHPVGMELVEIPAGLLDVSGEDYCEAARRELAEEVELDAARWNVLVDIFTTPGACEESLRIYLARDLMPATRPEGFTPEDEEAQMKVSFAPRTELINMVFAGRLENPSLVAGLLALETAIISGRLESLRPADAPWLARL